MNKSTNQPSYMASLFPQCTTCPGSCETIANEFSGPDRLVVMALFGIRPKKKIVRSDETVIRIR